jgi:hypothetical protein
MRTTVGNVTALECVSSVCALLWGKCLRLMWGKYRPSTLREVCALYCGARARALLWGKSLLSTVGQVSAVYFGASVRSLLCDK